MSTRSATIVEQRTYTSKDDYTVDELFRFYRHCDGYPEGHGLDMARAFADAEHEGTEDRNRWFSSGLNNRNWAQKCFAKVFSDDCDLEIEPAGCEHCDLSYLYVVQGAFDAYGGKFNVDALDVTISVFRKDSWDDDYAAMRVTAPVFSGTPDEYIKEYA